MQLWLDYRSPMHIVVKIVAIVTLSVISALTPLAAQSLDHLLGDLPGGVRRELLERGTVEQYTENRRDIEYMPRHPFSREIQRRVDDARPNVISEQLVLVTTEASPAERLELFNSLRRVSELSHLQYYNERTEQTNALFNESFAVRGPQDRRRIEDPTVSRLPREDSFFVLQGLPPFGTVVSRYAYQSNDEAFLFTGTNEDSLTYREMAVVRPGNMVTTILVIAGDDFVLMYGLGAVRAFKLFGLLDDRIEAAFSGRTEGLFDWYRSTYLSHIGG